MHTRHALARPTDHAHTRQTTANRGITTKTRQPARWVSTASAKMCAQAHRCCPLPAWRSQRRASDAPATCVERRASDDASAEPAPRQQLALNAAALREQGSRRAPAMLQRSSSGQPEGASPERRSGQSASRPAAQACSAPVTSSTRHTAPVPREAAGCKPASGPSPRRQGTRAAGSWLTRASGPSPRRRGTHEPPEAGSRALRGRRP